MTHPVVQYSAHIGRDPHRVQGAGGNVSWKDGDTMWVKASGTWLADAEQKDIFVPVNLAAIRADIATGDFSKPALALTDNGLRPSIETILHALMPHAVVVHTHPVHALAWLVQDNARSRLERALGDRFNWAFTGYHKPGAALALGVHEAIAVQGGRPDLVFLANHGVIVGGDSVAEVEGIYHALLEVLRIAPNDLPEMPALTDTAPQGYGFTPDPEIRALAFTEESSELLDTNWALYPDHVVFLGARPPRFGRLEDFPSQSSADKAYDYAIIDGQGVLMREGLEQNKIAMLKCFAEVVRRVKPGDVLHALTEADIDDLLNWDAEKFRKQQVR